MYLLTAFLVLLLAKGGRGKGFREHRKTSINFIWGNMWYCEIIFWEQGNFWLDSWDQENTNQLSRIIIVIYSAMNIRWNKQTNVRKITNVLGISGTWAWHKGTSGFIDGEQGIKSEMIKGSWEHVSPLTGAHN